MVVGARGHCGCEAAFGQHPYNVATNSAHIFNEQSKRVCRPTHGPTPGAFGGCAARSCTAVHVCGCLHSERKITHTRRSPLTGTQSRAASSVGEPYVWGAKLPDLASSSLGNSGLWFRKFRSLACSLSQGSADGLWQSYVRPPEWFPHRDKKQRCVRDQNCSLTQEVI